jgi:hypothetical protein
LAIIKNKPFLRAIAIVPVADVQITFYNEKKTSPELLIVCKRFSSVQL